MNTHSSLFLVNKKPSLYIITTTAFVRLFAPRTAYRFFCLFVTFLLTGCGDSAMRMDADLNTQLAGDLRGTVRLDGPVQIQMQMQGPTVRYKGTFVSEELLKRVKPDVTRADWILAVLGEPTGRAVLDDGSEIWKWVYAPIEQVASFVQVFGATEDEPPLQPVSAFVHLRAGVAIDTWRD